MHVRLLTIWYIFIAEYDCVLLHSNHANVIIREGKYIYNAWFAFADI
jgi:hypothetical protein